MNVLNLDDLLKVNDTHYLGDCHWVTIDKQEYPFVKGYLNLSPIKFGYKHFNVRQDVCATYVIQEIYSHKTYIGSSSRVYKRLVKHKTFIENKKHDNILFESLLKTVNTKVFDVIIIFTDTRDEAYDIEQLLINKYKDTGLLLNIANDVRLARLGASNSEWHAERLRQANIGKTISEENRKKLSDFRKTDEKAIAQFKTLLEAKKNKVMVYGVEYDSITLAGQTSGYSETYIRRCLDNLSKDKNIYRLSDNISPLKGRTLSDDRKKTLSEFKKTDPKSIAQLESIREKTRKKILFNGVMYDSVIDAMNKTGIHESTIHTQLKKQGGKADEQCYVLNYTKPEPKKVFALGKVYSSTTEAALSLGMKKSSLKSRVKSKFNKDFYYVI